MRNQVEFYEFEEARIHAGLFISELPEALGVSWRTLRRWKKTGLVPWWAYRIVCLLSGDLEPFGWPGWELRKGVLFQNSLNPRYHFWVPGDLLGDLFTLRRHNFPANDADYNDQLTLPFPVHHV